MLSARERGEEGEFVTVFKDILSRPMLAVDDPEEPDRAWDLEGTDDIIDRRAVGQFDHLFIRAEGPQGCEQLYFHPHRAIIPDFRSPKALYLRMHGI